MTRHYSEADLLETYYTQPGQSMPVMMHLAGCTDCAGRYERLDRKLRTAASCSTEEKPDTFWTRQRMLVMRRIDPALHQRAAAPRTARFAAAAGLAFLLGGMVVYKTVDTPVPSHQPVASSTQATATVPAPNAVAQSDEPAVPADAWQSEELQDFHSVVQWEGWVGDTAKGTDGSSL